MERKKRSKSVGWECCYANKIFGTFGVEMRACGQKLGKFCTHTHTDTHTHARGKISSSVNGKMAPFSIQDKLSCFRLPLILPGAYSCHNFAETRA